MRNTEIKGEANFVSLNTLDYDSGGGTGMYTKSREEISEIVSTKGELRGVVLCTDAEYVRQHEGEEALRRVEEETREMGYPLDYSKVKAMGWYPIGLRGVSLFAIGKTLNWDDE